MRIERHVDAAGIFVFVQNFFPGLAPIHSAENSALRIRTLGMPEGGHKNNVRVRGINNYFADGARITQPNVLPVLAAIERFVYAVAVRNVSAYAGFAGSHIKHIMIGSSHGNTPDR